MVKVEIVLPSDEAAIVWAALNAAIDTARAEPTPAEPTPAEHLVSELSPSEHLLAKLSAAQALTSADRGRHRANAFMNRIQERMRGNRPQRTPIEIVFTVPDAGLNGSAEPSDLATMADGELIATATVRRRCCDAGVVVAQVDAQGVLSP